MLRSDTKDGFVLVRAPLSVQRLVAASGLPVVVHGSLHPSVRGVPWVERDQSQIGALLGNYLLERGCRRIVALFRAEFLPGEAMCLDALLAAVSRAGLRPEDFVLRALPADLDAIEQAVLDLLSADDRMTGIFCRSERLVEGTLRAVQLRGQTLGRDVPGRDVEIAADTYRKPGRPRRVPSIATLLNAVEIGRHIGRMLAQQARGEPVLPDHEIIPVELEVPEGYARQTGDVAAMTE